MHTSRRILQSTIFAAAILFATSPGTLHAASLTQTLMLEQSGAEVTTLQQALAQLGYLRVAPTGYFGRLTYEGLISFQIAAGIQASGRSDLATRQALTRRLPGLLGSPAPAALPTSVEATTVAIAAAAPIQPTLVEAGESGGDPPRVSFRTTRANVFPGERFRLEWSSRSAESCTASGGWEGSKRPEGRQLIRSISETTTFSITCSSSGGTTTETVAVAIKGGASSSTSAAGTAPPRVQFASDRTVVPSGSSVVLNWEANNVISCRASGGWGGEQPLAGSVTTGAITENTTFRLSCTNGSGTVQRIIEVQIETALAGPAPVIPEVPPATTPPGPTPAPSTPTGGTYAVYAGCEAPSTTFLRTIYIDPARGALGNPGTQAAPLRTLQEAMAARVLRPGDRVILAAGDHGSAFANSAQNPNFATATRWIWLDFQPGSTVRKIEIRGLQRWLITGHTVRPEPGEGYGFMSSGGSHVIIADGRFASVDTTVGWTTTEWLKNTGNAISNRNTECVSLLRNRIENVRFGITISDDDKDPSQNAVRGLVMGNTIRGFAGDGIRPLGSEILVKGNTIVDSYGGSAEGDANHDDGIQLFALGGAVHDRISIEDNWIQETLSPSRPHIGSLQGIGHFDGPITNLRIVNNVVITSIWHGIATYGPTDALIERNTVANYTKNGRNSWIRVNVAKNGRLPVNATVRNNVARSINSGQGINRFGDVLVKDEATAYTVFDPAGNRFVLTPRPGGPLSGQAVGSTLQQPAY